MIVVAGEALADLVMSPGGRVTRHCGGGAFNTARTIGRLGQPVTFLGRLSTDPMGRLLRGALSDAGVRLDGVTPTDAPTTVALAELGEDGAASYRFVVEGTSVPGLLVNEARSGMPQRPAALHVGGLGLVFEPQASAIAALVSAVPASTLVMLDPNYRADAVPEPAEYRTRLGAVLRRTDVVKLSDDDLEQLEPDRPAAEGVRRILAMGPKVVLITHGQKGASVITPHGEFAIKAAKAQVVDTIGAGDAFGGGWLAFWVGAGLTRRDLDRPELLAKATRFAEQVAARTCERRGAEPPTAEQLGSASRLRFRPMWLDEAVVYEVYARSFQDSDGDGVGDLRGLTSRLEHIAGMGATAVWLSPIYPSPNADYGYDVSGYTAVHPQLGTLEDLDELVDRAHSLGLRVILDFVPCHTSIRHPWFREHPEYYLWADSPPNNWLASFGGSAWERDPDTGRYYLHSFFPEQADLNWRNPDVREAMSAALRFWRERGIDGFRLDALDRLLKDEQLRDDPPATVPPLLPLYDEFATLRHTHSGNAPDIGSALQSIRNAVDNAALVGEVYLPSAELGPYLDALDAVFAFEAMQASGSASALRGGIAAALDAGKQGWVLSNHDFSRLGNRVGPQSLRAATLLLLALPGPAFLFQGDELGLLDGSPDEHPHDRAGRDAFRRPIPWDSSANAGFTNGRPWLPVGDGITRSVEEQEGDPDSHLSLVRRLVNLKSSLGATARLQESPADTIVLDRGDHVVAVNLGDIPRPAPAAGELVIEARPGDGANRDVIPAHGGWIARSIR